MVDAFLEKKYKLTSSDNFNQFLRAVGASAITRKIGSIVKPTVILKKQGDEYLLSSMSTFKQLVLKFKPGEEFYQDAPDGKKVKTTITIDGNTLHEVQTDSKGKVTTIDRIFGDDEVKMVFKVDDVVSTRIYKRQS